jgi:hypothetical protein
VRHVRRTGALKNLSPVVQALLCPCDDCHQLVVQAAFDRARRNAVCRGLHPLCEYCGAPSIWRSITFVCPYSENKTLHSEIRELLASPQGSLAQSISRAPDVPPEALPCDSTRS